MGKYIKRYKNSILPTGLNLRSGLRGGRVENYKYHVEAKPGEKIGIYDVVSLFPFVQATAEFPYGHPLICLGIEIEEHFSDMPKAIAEKAFFGVVHCELFPPPSATFPAIPSTVNGRLYFHLC